MEYDIAKTEEITNEEANPIVAENIQLTHQQIKDSANALFDMKGLSVLEIDKLFDAIKAVKKDKNYDYQNAIPKKYRYLIANTAATLNIKPKQAARFIIDQIASDAEISSAVDTFKNEMNSVVAESNAELMKLVGKNENDLIAEMDAIKEAHPEKANDIDLMKNALLDAKTFDKEIDWYSSSSKNVSLHKRVCKHDNSEVTAFNKLINRSSIKCKSFEECVSAISMRSSYDLDAIIKTMLIVVAHFRYFKVEENIEAMSIENLAELYYINALLNNICNMRYEMILSEDSQKLLNSIEAIIPKFL